MKKIKQIVNVAKQQKTENKETLLENAIGKIAEIEEQYSSLDKVMKENKATVKSLCVELGFDSYEAHGKKITISHVDKSFLDIAPTIEWLKQNGFEKYVKTREYFDEAELAMAIVNNEIKAEDLAPFTVSKEELRLNIK